MWPELPICEREDVLGEKSRKNWVSARGRHNGHWLACPKSYDYAQTAPLAETLFAIISAKRVQLSRQGVKPPSFQKDLAATEGSFAITCTAGLVTNRTNITAWAWTRKVQELETYAGADETRVDGDRRLQSGRSVLRSQIAYEWRKIGERTPHPIQKKVCHRGGKSLEKAYET